VNSLVRLDGLDIDAEKAMIYTTIARDDMTGRAVTGEQKTAQVNLRLQPSLKKAAEKAATDDRRSLSGLIEKLLVDHLKKRSPQRRSPPRKK
jgi:hypothetical protein